MRATAVLAALALAAALPAAAQETRVTPDAFEAESEGWTLRFTLDGLFYGAEQYRPGRSVVWQDASGRCVAGRWFAAGEDVCFAYEDRPGAVCWGVWRDEAGLFARLAGDPEGDRLRVAGRERAPLVCPGPDAGV